MNAYVGHIPLDRPDLIALLSREMFADSSSQSCLAMGKIWLENCLREHAQCNSAHPKQHPLPSRVIDVGSDAKHPSLFVTLGQPGSWTALSYCWGGASDFVLTRARFPDLQKGFPASSAPKTIHDAIVITKALGIRYIWIDALCIFQDSMEDWSAEAPKMAAIYKNSLVTIAAAASPSVTAGILEPRQPDLAVKIPWKMPVVDETERKSLEVPRLEEEVSPGQASYVWLAERPWDDILDREESYWMTRGWTMQEELLASRILYFTSRQMAWECNTLVQAEADARPLPPRPSATFQTLKSMQKRTGSSGATAPRPGLELRHASDCGIDEIGYPFWYHLVTLYSQRDLTYARDRLPAVGGLAICMQASLADIYLAGLWKKDLVKGLLWYSTLDRPKASSEYVGPSWSWVAVGSRLMTWKLGGTEVYKELAVIDDVDLEYEAPDDPYGRVKRGALTLTAPYQHISHINSLSQHVHARFTKFQHFIDQVFEEQRGVEGRRSGRGYVELQHQHRPCPNQHFAALQIVAGSALRPKTVSRPEAKTPFLELLLLESTTDHVTLGKESEAEVLYRRIGQVSLRYTDQPRQGARPNDSRIGPVEVAAWCEVAEQEWPMRTITII